MKKFLTALGCLFLAGCATMGTLGTKPTGEVPTQSSGSLDMSIYKTFSVAYSSLPGTAQAMREGAVLSHIIFRLEQEGLKYVKKADESDVIVLLNFLDLQTQRYIPPRAYTSVSYDSNTTGTVNATGVGIGNYAVVNGAVNAQTTGTATATTTVSGGYYETVYGVGIALNIYDTKSKQLLWYGIGSREANLTNPSAAINDAVLTLIDKYLITPSYLSGKRQEIRDSYTKRYPQEYLQGQTDEDKLKPHVGVVNHPQTGVSVMTNILVINGSADTRLVVNFILSNQSNNEFVFDPKDFKLFLNGDEKEIWSKSQYVEAIHNTKTEGAGRIHKVGGGLLGFLGASIYNGVAASNERQHNQQVDGVIQNMLPYYLGKITLKPGDHTIAFAVVSGISYLAEQSKVQLHMPFEGKAFDVNYTYVPNWESYDQYQKMIRAKK